MSSPEAVRKYQASEKGKATKRARVLRHRKITSFMVGLHKAVPCADCGGWFPACAMDLDHRPGEKKKHCVALMVGAGNANWRAVMAEAAKCDVVCANCHRLRTWNRRQDARGT